MEGATEVDIARTVRLVWIRILFRMYVYSCLARGSTSVSHKVVLPEAYTCNKKPERTRRFTYSHDAV